MEGKAAEDCAAETRGALRSNLFLAASLVSAGVGHPVRIRDLSPTGARVETAVVPEVGSRMSLVRGRLGVACQVTWTAEHFCGLRFATPVSVLEWMTHPHAQQKRRVSDLVAASGRVAGGDDSEAAGGGPGAEKAVRVARDLARVSRLLETLGEALAGDPHVVARHSVKLHTLALAIQTLSALAETMRAGAGEGGSEGRSGAAAAGGAAR